MRKDFLFNINFYLYMKKNFTMKRAKKDDFTSNTKEKKNNFSF